MSSPVMRLFLLLFALSAPLWLIGAVTRVELRPGIPVTVIALPFLPVIAALILTSRQHGRAGVKALLARSFDFHRMRHPGWYIPAVMLKPAIVVVAYILLRLQGWPVPLYDFSFVTLLGMVALFFAWALGEELAWSGYVIDPMQHRLDALRGGVLLGVVWAVWHLPTLIQGGRTAAWIAWWALGTIATRVILVWLYNNTGKSVFAASIYHTMDNLAVVGVASFTSLAAERYLGLLTAAVAGILILGWGSRTLATYRGLRAIDRVERASVAGPGSKRL
ncbi:MAG TPA: CPBP family intramembrane glutamic endopeptidase [Acidimicrobiia bacterium]